MKECSIKLSGKQWAIVFIVVILSYGFLLTNQSIGIDDEGFQFYFDNYGLAISGRYGSLILKQIFDTYGYYPVWREGIALVLMVCGTVVFLNLFQKLSQNKFSGTACVIFICTVITYPLYAKTFVYITGCIEIALVLVLASISLHFTFEYFKNSYKRNLLYTILSLTFGISLVENCMNYYLTGLLIGLYIIYFYDNHEYKPDIKGIGGNFLWILKKLLLVAALMIVGIVLNSIISKIVAGILNVEVSAYGGKFIAWDFSNFSVETVNSFISSLYSVLKVQFVTTTYFKVFVICVAVYVIDAAIQAYKRKNIILAILAVCVIISTLIFYIITGNVGMVARTFVVYAVFSGFVLSFIYTRLNSKTLQKIALIFIVFIIFYQSREIQAILSDDYIRFEKDSHTAKAINYDIEKECNGTPSVPVVFVGSPLQYIEYPNVNDDVNMRSMFSGNENGESIRIHSFFRMLGYNYISPLQEAPSPGNYKKQGGDELTEKAKTLAKSMTIWPESGSVLASDDVIVVKLGPLPQQYFEMTQDEFESRLSTNKRNVKPAQGNIEIARVENQTDDSYEIYIKGYAYFETMSSRNSRISIILDRGSDHYILSTQQQEIQGDAIAAIDKNAGNNLNEFRTYAHIPISNSGEWALRIMIDNGSYTTVIDGGGISEIVIH